MLKSPKVIQVIATHCEQNCCCRELRCGVAKKLMEVIIIQRLKDVTLIVSPMCFFIIIILFF